MRVVHCKRSPYSVYIGRPSVFENRFSHRRSKLSYVTYVDTAEEAVKAFEADARQRLMQAIAALPEDAVLGCWCKITGDEPCHGDTIMKLWREIHGVYGVKHA